MSRSPLRADGIQLPRTAWPAAPMALAVEERVTRQPCAERNFALPVGAIGF